MKEMMKGTPQSLPEQIKETKPSHSLEDYTGTFQHPAYGTLEVYKQNDNLHLRFESFDVVMNHYHYDMFSTTWNVFQNELKVMLAYEMSTDGSLEKVQLHLPVMLSTQPLTFTKIK